MNRLLGRLARLWLASGLDLLFPPRCAGCGAPGEDWCTDCDQAIARITGPVCQLCGSALSARQACPSCSSHPFPICVRSYAYYRGPLVRALLQLKYRPNRRLAARMGMWLVETWHRARWPGGLVTAVPLSPTRLRQRGYNQAAIIASAMARTANLPFMSEALVRTRETLSQVGLGPEARWRNVEGAFEARTDAVEGQVVIIVDDLLTTGATLAACATAAQTAGAHRVLALTVGRAQADPHEPDKESACLSKWRSTFGTSN